MSLLMVRFRSLSWRRCSSILAMECMTVVWCLPPNWRPISGREASVICLARYIAIWRGTTIWRELFFCLSSGTRMPNCSATARWMASMVILRTWVSMNCLRHCWATAREHLDAMMGAPGDDADERAFEFADVGADVGGDKERDVGGDDGVLGVGLALQDGDLGFEVGGLDVGDEAPLEAGAETVFDVAELLGGPVGGEDDLLGVAVEGVEGVEELFLGFFLAGEELDVVDEEDVDGAVLVAEAGHLVEARGVGEVVDELLAGDVADGGVGLEAFYLVADGVHEVGLAHADAAVEEERVVGLGGSLGDGDGGGEGELVAGAGDEAVEVVARVELRGCVPVEAGLLGRGCGLGGGGWLPPGDGPGCACGVAGQGCKATVLTDSLRGGILCGRLELHGFDIELKAFDGFFDEIGVLVADVFKLRGRDADVQGFFDDARKARGLQPGFEGLPVDLFFERAEDAHPLVQHGGGRRDE